MKTKLIILMLILLGIQGCAKNSDLGTVDDLKGPMPMGARSVTAFPVVTPAADDYWILTDTSNSGLFSKVATSGVRAAIGLAATDSVSFASVTATGVGGLKAGVAGSQQGALVLYTNTDPVYSFGITPAATPSATVSLKMPPAMPTADNSLLNFDINGTGGWTDPASLGGSGLTSLPSADNQILQATGVGTYGWTSTLQGIGAITADSYNLITVTQPATSATLTLANGSTLATSGADYDHDRGD
jgi:hypothetical protein